MILIVGACSRLGKALAERLLERGLPFRAACRDVAKAQWLSERGVEVVALDVASGSGLEAPVRGATRVVSCVHGLMGRWRRSIEQVDVEGQGKLIDACVAAGVERFVYLSALGASADHPSPFWRAKARTEARVKASGLDYVILRPSAFMDLYAHDLIGAAVMKGKPAFVLGSGRIKRNMIAVADVADAVVEAVLRDELSGETIDIGGPDNVSERDVAALYGELTGKKVKVVALPLWALRLLAPAAGLVHAGVGQVMRMPLQLGDREDLRLAGSGGVEKIGIRPMSLREFAKGKVGR